MSAELRAAAADLAGDLRAWIEWANLTGADAVPIDPNPRAILQPSPAPAPAQRGRPSPQRHEQRPPAPPPRPPRPPRAPGVAETIDDIRHELGDCQRCGLAGGRKHIVFGVGNPNADLMLIGEAPGYYEDVTGEPFVGRSGQLLTRMLGCIGLRRDEVYICNVLKCRPPDNRDPEPAEVAACSPFLHRQVKAVAPKVILTLGRFAAVNMVGLDEPLARLRRQVRSYEQLPVVATFHPAYLLRKPKLKRDAWRDLLQVRNILRTGTS